MTRLFYLLAVALLGCTSAAPPPAIPPSPVVSPPPPAPRLERFARVTGSVTDVAGSPVESAVVRVWSADATCQQLSQAEATETDQRGTFRTEVEFGPGEDIPGCVIAEALAGGASGRAATAVVFSLSEAADALNRTNVDIRLDPPRRMDRAEADRIIGLLDRAMRSHDPEVNRELLPYVRVGGEALRMILADHANLLRGIASTEFIDAGTESFTYVLHGRNGKTLPTTVAQPGLIQLTNAIVQHGVRARLLLEDVIYLSASGQVARLASVLGTDAARAAALAERLATGYDLVRIVRLEGVDPVAQTLRYRLVANSGDPNTPEQVIELGYSDHGTLWLRSF